MDLLFSYQLLPLFPDNQLFDEISYILSEFSNPRYKQIYALVPDGSWENMYETNQYFSTPELPVTKYAFLVIVLETNHVILARYSTSTQNVHFWNGAAQSYDLHDDSDLKQFPLYHLLHDELCICSDLLSWIAQQKHAHEIALQYWTNLELLAKQKYT